MGTSKNQKNKQTYIRISRGKYLPVGLHRIGLLRRWYWVSHHYKAQRIKDIPDDHLVNIIGAVKIRHPEADIEPLLKEARKRRGL